MPSKYICILLLISMLMMGCFIKSSITKEELVPDDRKMFLYLQDGSYIKSFSGNHHRLDSGYQIVGGEIMRPNEFPRAFDGVVRDVEIAKVKVERFSFVGTVLGCVLGGLVIAFPVGLIVAK
jgi:hypothetical protein